MNYEISELLEWAYQSGFDAGFAARDEELKAKDKEIERLNLKYENLRWHAETVVQCIHSDNHEMLELKEALKEEP